MVVDWVLTAVKAVLSALIGLLPAVGAVPEEASMVWDVIGWGNRFLPVYEIYQYLVWAMPAALGAWLVFRFVRMFFPGG